MLELHSQRTFTHILYGLLNHRKRCFQRVFCQDLFMSKTNYVRLLNQLLYGHILQQIIRSLSNPIISVIRQQNNMFTGTSRAINQHFAIFQTHILGKGSTGNVHLGYELTNPSRKVAIKAIDLKNIDNEVTKYLLGCQITALTQLGKVEASGSQHIVKLFEIATFGAHIYLITELLEGGTLAQYMKRHPNGLPQDEAMAIFRQILQGYQHIRSKNIVHRDLKPDNILFKSRPQLSKNIAIIDFGYCEMAEVANKPQMFYNVGSPKYMSPQAYQDNLYSQKSDIWALGVILYQLLLGRTCDQGLSMQSYLDMLRKRGVFIPQNLNPIMRELLNNMLCISYHQRPNAIQILQRLKQAQFNNNQPVSKQNQVFQSTFISPMSRMAPPEVKNSLIHFKHGGSPEPQFSRNQNFLQYSPDRKLVKCDSAKVMPQFTFNSQKKAEFGSQHQVQNFKIKPVPSTISNKPSQDCFPLKPIQQSTHPFQPRNIATHKNIRFNQPILQTQHPHIRYTTNDQLPKQGVHRADRIVTEPSRRDQNCIRIHIKGNAPKLTLKSIGEARLSIQKQSQNHFVVQSPERGEITDRKRLPFDSERKLIAGFTVKDSVLLNNQRVNQKQPVLLLNSPNTPIRQQNLHKAGFLN